MRRTVKKSHLQRATSESRAGLFVVLLDLGREESQRTEIESDTSHSYLIALAKGVLACEGRWRDTHSRSEEMRYARNRPRRRYRSENGLPV